jgi:nitronate monooxygenase
MFLSDDLSSQVGTFALVPQIVDAVKLPVIAAGGIADARGIAAAFHLGASAVQVGTAYLFTAEAKISAAHHKALRTAKDSETALTNLFTGRPARGILNRVMREIGPMSDKAPAFPLAGGALMPLRAKDPADFANLWAGQAFRLGIEMPAAELTRRLAEEALAKLAHRYSKNSTTPLWRGSLLPLDCAAVPCKAGPLRDPAGASSLATNSSLTTEESPTSSVYRHFAIYSDI